jgi:CRISPR system Cascade subunit CasD
MTAQHRWLVLRLEAPLVSFGGVTVDQIGVTRDFPSASMLTGLIANALGWERTAGSAHQALQDRLIFAARRERESPTGILTDTQNAKLEARDAGWTTRGEPEGRAGATYDSPHRRRRDYHVDESVTVALRLEPPLPNPDLNTVAAALDHPARPIFLGRKPCLPATPVRFGEVEASTAYDALCLVPPAENKGRPMRALWPDGEGPTEGPRVLRVLDLADLRNWKTGLHGGSRRVVEGMIVIPGVNP